MRSAFRAGHSASSSRISGSCASRAGAGRRPDGSAAAFALPASRTMRRFNRRRSALVVLDEPGLGGRSALHLRREWLVHRNRIRVARTGA